MKRLLTVVPLLLVVAGCAPPTVTKGTFTAPYTLTIQRGSVDVVVKTTGTGSYTITNYAMDHPMGPRPDTEATFVTPAGTFKITDKDVKDGLLVNGKLYPHVHPGPGRITITIDEQGAVTMDPPDVQTPKPDMPAPPKE